MAKINILPPEIYNRIAAGEVVERPASVVKELIENAIDAGATQIKVRIEQAGTKLIAVSDNGCGMDSEDALLSLQPHGTSKIKCVEDIDRIGTLGFRGEAIPSIASVSRMQIRTRQHDSDSGFEVVVSGGKVEHSGPVGCAPGSEIAVRELFYNTPARRKFLRSNATEESYIDEVVILAALANLHVSFEFIVNGRQVYFSAGDGRLEPRLRDFFGRKYAENMIPVKFESGNIRIHGMIGQPGLTRSSRREQRGFINGRPIESQAIYRGIRDGYGTLNERGRYSPCVLFITMPFSEFDINVHPAKREVRFRHEYNVSRAVTMAVNAALRNVPAPESSLDVSVSLEAILRGAEIAYTISEQEQPQLITESQFKESASPKPVAFTNPAEEDSLWRNEPIRKDEPAGNEPPPTPEIPDMTEEYSAGGYDEAGGKPEDTREFVGLMDNTYLIFYNDEDKSLEITDQHAAHERVLYERILRQSVANQTVSQPLLIPQMIELSRPEAGWLEKNEELLSKLGFEVAALSSNTLMLNAVPAVLPQAEWEEVLHDIYLAGRESSPDDPRPALERAAAAACHAAVKAHDVLTKDEVASLVEQMRHCERPDICPHGRPTTIKITLKELEKRFGRR